MKATLQQGPRLLWQIRPTNILSFGPDTEALPLESLNVLIGPNGAGKSNLIEVLTLLQACPTDLREAVRRGGGVADWVWKGASAKAASVEAVVDYGFDRSLSLRHVIEFQEDNHSFRLAGERIEDATPGPREPEQYFYRYQHGMGYFRKGGSKDQQHRSSVEAGASIISQRRDPEGFPEISHLAESYRRMSIYREWTFGRNTVFRLPQKADLRSDRLEEDFSNLGLFLNRLRFNPKAKADLLTGLRDLYEGVNDFELDISGGTVQVHFIEDRASIPATRLSDGSLRYLCLLAILCDPEPPPLICIEEPELGLHPDILPKLADLLVAASERTQLIVTTHSDILVDAMTERPEVVVVCEKHDGQTTMKRQRKEDLAVWLDKYRLGQLWTKGQIGGTRW